MIRANIEWPVITKETRVSNENMEVRIPVSEAAGGGGDSGGHHSPTATATAAKED